MVFLFFENVKADVLLARNGPLVVDKSALAIPMWAAKSIDVAKNSYSNYFIQLRSIV